MTTDAPHGGSGAGRDAAAARSLEAVVKRSFTPERRVLVHLSPFEG